MADSQLRRGAEGKMGRQMVQNRIPAITSKKQREAQILAKIKAEKIERLGKACECCGSHGQVDLSHHIPGSKGLPYKLDPEASCLSCRPCHVGYEGLKYHMIANFKNLATILAYLKPRNPTRHDKIIEGINKLQN